MSWGYPMQQMPPVYTPPDGYGYPGEGGAPFSVTGGGSNPMSGVGWGAVGGGLGALLASLFGGDSQNSAIQQSAQQMQQSQSGMSSQLMQMIQQMTGAGAGMQGASAPAVSSIIGGIGNSGQNLGLSNSVFAQEAATGLSPIVQSNAQNQLLQGYDASLNDIKAQATPGSNISGAMQNAQNQYLGQTVNLAGNLANTSQQYKQSGAQGLTQNLMDILNQAQGFTGLGNQLQTSAASNLNSLDQFTGEQAFNYAQLALQNQPPSPWAALGSIFGGLAPLAFGA